MSFSKVVYKISFLKKNKLTDFNPFNHVGTLLIENSKTAMRAFDPWQSA